jgi:formylglycine-generating enzyme required for sulfatase activity
MNMKTVSIIVFIVILSLFTTGQSIISKPKLTKLYISSIKAKGLPVSIAEKVREGIKLTIFEKYSNRYYLLDDEAIKVMYKQAEQILASGCDDTSCMTQIADGINADEVIYGTVSKAGTKLKFSLSNLMRNRRTLTLSTKSFVSIDFFESQLDHFIKEAALKLMNKEHRIDMSAADSFQNLIMLDTMRSKKGLEINLLRFRSSDEIIKQITNLLKDDVRAGDNSYNGGNYDSAIESYRGVLRKVKTKAPEGYQRRLSPFVEGVVKRMIRAYGKKIEKISNTEDVLSSYRDIENSMKSMPGPMWTAGMRKIEQEISEKYILLIEENGNICYRKYKFEDAISYYEYAVEKASALKGSSRVTITSRLKKKIRTSEKTGSNYFANRVKTLLDQAVYFNFKDDAASAVDYASRARQAIETSFFKTEKAIEDYNKIAKVTGAKRLEKKIVKLRRKLAVIRTGQMKKIGGIEFISIKGGCYNMGSNEQNDEKPVHRVCVDSFWMGKYEVTQEQYKAVTGTNPSKLKGSNKPVEMVSWKDAMGFLESFNSMYGANTRLPYEAEWEYAARAGTNTKYYWGNSVNGAYAWYSENSGGQTHPVGQKNPNSWGLYDMSGNVFEWCMDWYAKNYYRNSPVRNPNGSMSGEYLVIRGGSWLTDDNNLRSADRSAGKQAGRGNYVGFRVILPAN